MTMRLHLSILQPPAYIHSQGFLDQARYVRYQFRRLGAVVTIGKNRLREDSINLIFGAHLGFDPALRQRYTCVFVNLEQLGDGGARVTEDYLNLLRTSAVIDYDDRNLASYDCKPGDVPLVSFQWAPYLATSTPLPLQDRPIDLLFFGSLNERRKALFARIEACGWSVSMFDHPLYGQERDQFIRQAKAVFNCHFYETSRFEQARAFHTLSLGTPVISERTKRTTPPAAFENAVTWVSHENLEAFFSNEFMTPAWIQRTAEQSKAFESIDDLATWELVHEYCQAVGKTRPSHAGTAWRPERLNLWPGPQSHYKLGWLNVQSGGEPKADLILDLSAIANLPIQSEGTAGATILLEHNQFDEIYCQEDLTQAKQSHTLMRNLLKLLKPDGILKMELPCSGIPDWTPDAQDLIADSRARWAHFCEHFWNLGLEEHRFEVAQCSLVDSKSRPCEPARAASVLLTLCKTETTAREKTRARAHLTDFGCIEADDLPRAAEQSSIGQADNLPARQPSGKMSSKKFIFYTPHYDDNSGGLIAIYKLAHLLNENGHQAKIWHWTRLHKNEVRMINGKVAKEFFIPKNVSQIDVDCPYPIIEAAEEDIADSIVVYPEIIESNPLGAKRVVRWLLNKPGAITGATSYGFGDLIFHHADHFLPDGLQANEQFRLHISDMKTYLYKDTYQGKREGVYFMVRKGRDVPRTYHPKGAIQVDGKSHAELAEIFAKAQMFISYDLHTAYSKYASLCGCDSVVVPRPGLSREQWKVGKDQADTDGIAYGYEDIERARKTRPAMIATINEGQALNLQAMNNFLTTCERYLGRNSSTVSVRKTCLDVS